MVKRKYAEEVILFADHQDAMNVKVEAEYKVKKAEELRKLSIIGSLLNFFPLFGSLAAVIISIICYKKLRCFSTAAKWGAFCAKWGWILCPIFPLDLIVALGGFRLGIYCSFFFPFFIVRYVKKRAAEEIVYAEAYLNDSTVVEVVHSSL